MESPTNGSTPANGTGKQPVFAKPKPIQLGRLEAHATCPPELKAAATRGELEFKLTDRTGKVLAHWDSQGRDLENQ
jgi:hypothetical protein